MAITGGVVAPPVALGSTSVTSVGVVGTSGPVPTNLPSSTAIISETVPGSVLGNQPLPVVVPSDLLFPSASLFPSSALSSAGIAIPGAATVTSLMVLGGIR